MKIGMWVLVFFLFIPAIDAQDLKGNFSDEEKIFGVSKLWSEVKYNFAFLDKLTFDFDSLYLATIPKVIATKNNFEYLHVLQKFLRALEDGHTSMSFDQFYWDQGDYPPVFVRAEKGQYLVSRISKEYVNKIPLGSQLLKADGIPYEEFRKRNPAGNLFYFLNTKVELEFRTPSGDLVKERFTRNYNHLFRTGNPIDIVSKENFGGRRVPEYTLKLENKLSIVEIGTFTKDTIVELFASDIPKINQTKGLILDVRRNGGGNSEFAKGIAKHLVQREILVGPSWRTKVNNAAKKAWGSMAILGWENDWIKNHQDYWTGQAWEIHNPDTTIVLPETAKVSVPIVILMGEKTFSAAEDFLIYTMGNKNITKIGQNSAGSSGQPLYVRLPGGFLAKICAKRDALPDGTDYIGIGVKPDIKLNKEENALEFAKKFLLKK